MGFNLNLVIVLEISDSSKRRISSSLILLS